MQVSNYANLSDTKLSDMERELSGHRSLRDVVKWGFDEPPGAINPQVVADIVIQDEFSHDVIVPWRDGMVLVYGAT